MSTYFYFSFAVLALLLFFPTSKLLWVASVRRMQRKRGSELSEHEINGQKSRSQFIAIVIVTLFSWFFNLNLLGQAGG